MDKKTKKEVRRFRFPKELKDKADLKMVGEDWEFFAKRHDPYMNGYNLILALAWQANIDWSTLFSPQKVRKYITKWRTNYASNSEPTSDAFVQFLKIGANESNPTAPAIEEHHMKTLRKDTSFQEVARHNAGEKLHALI